MRTRPEAEVARQARTLCRCITRPALASERVPCNSAGQIALKLKTWGGGSTIIVLSQLEFMQRLAALAPWPRLRHIRFQAVLAPNAKLRTEGADQAR